MDGGGAGLPLAISVPSDGGRTVVMQGWERRGPCGTPHRSLRTLEHGGSPIMMVMMADMRMCGCIIRSLRCTQSLFTGDKAQFTHILRVLNTNIEGRQKVAYALTAVKGVGRRYSTVVCKKAGVDTSKRAGELTTEELERLVSVIQNPREHKIPDWFLNRQKDVRDGTYSQVLANGLDNKMREDLERLKKIKVHRGLRHFWGLRVRGQHTKTTGRRGRTVGVSKKK